MTKFNSADYGILYLRLLNFKNRIEQTEKAMLSKHGLTRNDTLVISALGVSELTLTELCKLCCIDKSTITKVVKKLEDNGFLFKTTGRKRGYSIALTDKGRELNDKSTQVFKLLQNSATEFLSTEEIRSLNSLLDKILKLPEDRILSEIEKRIGIKGGK